MKHSVSEMGGSQYTVAECGRRQALRGPGGRGHTCEYCRKTFPSRRQLKEHSDNDHECRRLMKTLQKKVRERVKEITEDDSGISMEEEEDRMLLHPPPVKIKISLAKKRVLSTSSEDSTPSHKEQAAGTQAKKPYLQPLRDLEKPFVPSPEDKDDDLDYSPPARVAKLASRPTSPSLPGMVRIKSEVLSAVSGIKEEPDSGIKEESVSLADVSPRPGIRVLVEKEKGGYQVALSSYQGTITGSTGRKIVSAKTESVGQGAKKVFQETKIVPQRSSQTLVELRKKHKRSWDLAMRTGDLRQSDKGRLKNGKGAFQKLPKPSKVSIRMGVHGNTKYKVPSVKSTEASVLCSKKSDNSAHKYKISKPTWNKPLSTKSIQIPVQQNTTLKEPSTASLKLKKQLQKYVKSASKNIMSSDDNLDRQLGDSSSQPEAESGKEEANGQLITVKITEKSSQPKIYHKSKSEEMSGHSYSEKTREKTQSEGASRKYTREQITEKFHSVKMSGTSQKEEMDEKTLKEQQDQKKTVLLAEMRRELERLQEHNEALEVKRDKFSSFVKSFNPDMAILKRRHVDKGEVSVAAAGGGEDEKRGSGEREKGGAGSWGQCSNHRLCPKKGAHICTFPKVSKVHNHLYEVTHLFWWEWILHISYSISFIFLSSLGLKSLWWSRIIVLRRLKHCLEGKVSVLMSSWTTTHLARSTEIWSSLLYSVVEQFKVVKRYKGQLSPHSNSIYSPGGIEARYCLYISMRHLLYFHSHYVLSKLHHAEHTWLW